MPKKNETTKKPVPGVMAFMCNRCKGTVFFPVSILLFSIVKTWGMKEYKLPCERCGDTLHLTLEP
jgi:hypothetical protein